MRQHWRSDQRKKRNVARSAPLAYKVCAMIHLFQPGLDYFGLDIQHQRTGFAVGDAYKWLARGLGPARV